MRKVFLALIFLVASPAFGASLTPAYIKTQIPAAAIVGQGRMTYMMWSLYDAVLYAPHGRWQEGQPVALSLTYLRHLNGRKIADKSAEEIRAQGFSDEVRLAAWQNQMSVFFPNVEEGTNLTGLLDSKGQTVFYRDGREIGRIKDLEFGRHFFAIWLNPETSAPELRTELLGLLTQRG